ncbi:MAG TPA: LuxR C-terminal-related transcriptional regulator [Actinomycetes bacterium]
MSQPLLSSKIHPPRPRQDQLIRARLLGAVSTSSAPLVLVTGPAGSGKTVLVRQLAEQVDEPVAWLALDPRDNDESRFWTYFAGAVREAAPRLEWAPTTSITAVLLESLAIGIAAAGPLWVVLDDLHFVIDSRILHQLEQLIDMLPDDIRIVLASRTVPAMRLARIRATHRLCEITGRDLLFTTAEVAELFGSTDGTAAQIQAFTGGWAVAVGFATQLPAEARLPAATQRPSARSRQALADYLTEEILRSQPRTVQRFLLDTSILDEITVEAANDIRGAHDAATRLSYLARHDIFLSGVDGAVGDAWRHHALVRDHLQQTLERDQPARWRQLHQNAAEYSLRTHDPDRAIAYALAAGDVELAAQAIQHTASAFAGPDSDGWTAQPLRWLEALPDVALQDSDELRLLALGLAAVWSRDDLVDRWLAARGSRPAGDLEAAFAEVWQADRVRDLPRTAVAAREALALCQPGSRLHHYVLTALTPAELMQGNIDAALRLLPTMQWPFDKGMNPSFGSAQEFLRAVPVVLLAEQGMHTEAEGAVRALRQWLDRARGVGYPGSGLLDWVTAMQAYYQGDIETAAAWTALPGEEFFESDRDELLVVRLHLARVRRAAGDRATAEQLVADLRRRLASFTDPGAFGEWVTAEECALGVRPGTPLPGRAGLQPQVAGSALPHEPLSPRELEVLRMLSSEFTLPEIAAHLFVSYNTVKTHMKALYRKLGVRSRSAAVAHARTLGYLDGRRT